MTFDAHPEILAKENCVRKLLVLAGVTSLGMLAATSSIASETLVKFEGAVGVHPVGGNSAAGAATVVNTVRGISPGGRPWGIRSLRATVKTDGTVRITGEGLVLAGGDTAGTRGTVRQVVATLFCGSNTGLTSAPSDLSVGGDFDIRGVLDALPPTPCGNDANPPTLLIRNFANGAASAWFAVGILSD